MKLKKTIMSFCLMYSSIFLTLPIKRLPVRVPALCTPVSSLVQGALKNMIYNQIDKAQKSILILSYWFTDKDVARKLAFAQARMNPETKQEGVCVVLDSSSLRNRFDMKRFLENFNIPVYQYISSDLQHNKVMIIDDKKVITGSLNFTKKAFEANHENMVLMESPEIAQYYKKYFFEIIKEIKGQKKEEDEQEKKFLKELKREKSLQKATFHTFRQSQKNK